MDDDKPSLEALAHSGVKGMKWGVRKSELPGVSRSTNREASKDAKEFARAKMFYGEGAGTRRKLIKAKVQGKSGKDPSYKKAFDHHLSSQDMSTHASKARGERARKNAVNSTTKTARGIGNILRGNERYASLAAAMLFGGAMYAHKSGIASVVSKAAKTKYIDIRDRRATADLLRKMGVK